MSLIDSTIQAQLALRVRALQAENESLRSEIERLRDTLKRQDKAHHIEVQEQVSAERERCANLRTVAAQVMRDMNAQGVLLEWQTLLDEALAPNG